MADEQALKEEQLTETEQEQETSEPQKEKKTLDKWVLIPILTVLAGIALIVVRPDRFANASAAGQEITTWPKITREITVEAGSKLPTISDFVEGENLTDAKIVAGLDETTNMNTVADYNVTLNLLGRNIPGTLHVVDTIPPVIETQDREIFDYDGIEAMDFITSIEDATETFVSFSIGPDENKDGNHKILLSVRDEGGNITVANANLKVFIDKTAPVISGVQDITIYVGGKVSYLNNVTVTDDFDPDPKLEVDNSEVNIEEPGDYNVIYTAKDSAGNKAEVTSVLHVKKPAPGQIIVTEEMVYAEADKILAKITTPEMSQYEKAQAIYTWSHDKIMYVHMENKTDWVKGAWDGLVNKKGDCYVYAQASRALLTRAGIKNMIIHKIPAATVHYWNLIDIGEGWRHFDATRRRDGSLHFYETQEQIINYSNTHNLSHNYDKELFPDIP